MKPNSRDVRRWLYLAAVMATPVLPLSAQKVFFETFDSVPLGPNPEEASKGDRVWTRTPPTGWTVDDSQMPGYGTPDYAANDGRTEWSGWAFADVKWWPTVDDQRRSEFVLASGAAAIADPDEWDDATHLKGLYNAYMSSPAIDVTGKAANSLVMAFDSSWRPEGHDDGGANWPVDADGQPINNQTAVITAQWDDGTPVEVMRWDSVQDSPYFHDHMPNESVMFELKNPANAKKLVLKFGLIEAANDWWWAFDNFAVGTPPMVTSVTATGTGFTVRITEGLGKTVNENAAITAKLDGQDVTVTKSRDGDKVLVSHTQAPKIFVPGSKHLVEVTFTTGAGQPVVDSADFTAPAYTQVSATPTVVTASISEKADVTVDETKGVKLELDGTGVTPLSVKRVDLTAADGTDLPDRIDVVYAAATPFAAGSSHSLKVTFTTKTAQEVVDNASFKAPDYKTLPASLATDIGTGAQAGMKWRTHQVASRDTSIAAAEKQLAGELGASEHDTTGQVAAGYFEINYVNFDQNAGDAGNFNSSAAGELAVADLNIPGIPGVNGSTDNIAGEALAYVEIPQPGVYSMVVNSDDGFQVSMGNASSPTYLVLGSFDGGRGQADTQFYFRAEKAGVYLFRLLYFEGGGDARVEWFTVNADGTRALVNGTQPGALKAFRTRTVAEPALPAPGPGNLTGLLGYWRMDETDGTAVPDWSGNGHPGKIINNAAGSWVTDAERGTVYKANGTNVIDFGTILPVMSLTNDFTWSLWLNSTETGTAAATDNNIVFGNRYNTAGADFNPREFIKFTPSKFEWHVNAAGQDLDYPDFPTNKWTHHVVVKSGSKLAYYRDGALVVNTNTITGAPKNPQPLYLGGQGTQERWKGMADEVAIFGRALSAAEVQQAFDLGKAGQPLVPQPMAITSAKIDGANLTITWTGGTPPFKVQTRESLSTGTWTDVGAPTSERTASVPRQGAAGFVQIVGQ